MTVAGTDAPACASNQTWTTTNAQPSEQKATTPTIRLSFMPWARPNAACTWTFTANDLDGRHLLH
ncbi:hypothetical protein C5142_03165 [Rhodococcus sp. BGS-1C]|uniref:hypothetical protein n=1 Tax=Nocardiaceae TaxID=85025 RepID=UPI0011152792|nr:MULTISPECIES: hypothetical protein [Rhodococcus]MCC8930840.1 hypothetical protein [Rhodococcus sp. I2R]MCZ4278660.1 hypothetical protein [Rhodococcus yunnanensis]